MTNRRTTWLFALLLSFLPALAFAANGHSKTITLDDRAQIGNVQLKPGQYTLKWDDSSTNPMVTFYKGRSDKVVATAPAEVKKRKTPSNADFEFNTASGNKMLDRVYLKGETLVFGNDANSSSGSTMQ